MTHKIFLVLISMALALAGCASPAPTPVPPTSVPPTATSLPTPTFTPTPDLAATQTAQAQATATAQTLATANAQAQADATRTAQAQASATAQVQATAAARANATATITALVASINAQSTAAPGNPYKSAEGKEDGQPSPYLTAFETGQYLKNFDAQAQILNPADPKIHPWDYGFRFRGEYPNGYDLTLYSDGSWRLFLIQKGLADSLTGKVVARGVLQSFDNSPTGSNTVRLFAKDGSGFLFVNGDFVTGLDLSELKDAGSIDLATAMSGADNFPGLTLRWKNLSIKTLP